MREVILKNCDVIHDREIDDILGSDEASTFFTAQGDIDGDGHDEIVVCNHSGPVAIIKRSHVYKISNRPHDHSICSVHIFALRGSKRSEVITISLTGLCSVYHFKGLLGENERNDDESHFDDRTNTKSQIEYLDIPDYSAPAKDDRKSYAYLTLSFRQTGLAKNVTAAQIFMYVARLRI